MINVHSSCGYSVGDTVIFDGGNRYMDDDSLIEETGVIREMNQISSGDVMVQLVGVDGIGFWSTPIDTLIRLENGGIADIVDDLTSL